MEIAQIEAFLVLAEELHFGRTSERLHVSQPMVSRRVASLEREVGGTLFERTSRRVRLTPLGDQLRAQLQPAYSELKAAIGTAHNAAHGMTGVLHLGFVTTAPSEPLTRLVDGFETRHPECRIMLREHVLVGDDWDVWGPLRSGESDALVYYNAVNVTDQPDLSVGPVIERFDRVLLVSRSHRLSGRAWVSVEELADEELLLQPPNLPASVMELLNPSVTPSGRPIPHTRQVRSVQEAMTLVALGRVVHPTAAGNALTRRDDNIVAVPLRGLPPIDLVLIWCTAHENARIRALAKVARSRVL